MNKPKANKNLECLKLYWGENFNTTLYYEYLYQRLNNKQ